MKSEDEFRMDHFDYFAAQTPIAQTSVKWEREQGRCYLSDGLKSLSQLICETPHEIREHELPLRLQAGD